MIEAHLPGFDAIGRSVEQRIVGRMIVLAMTAFRQRRSRQDQQQGPGLATSRRFMSASSESVSHRTGCRAAAAANPKTQYDEIATDETGGRVEGAISGSPSFEPTGRA